MKNGKFNGYGINFGGCMPNRRGIFKDNKLDDKCSFLYDEGGRLEYFGYVKNNCIYGPGVGFTYQENSDLVLSMERYDKDYGEQKKSLTSNRSIVVKHTNFDQELEIPLQIKPVAKKKDALSKVGPKNASGVKTKGSEGRKTVESKKTTGDKGLISGKGSTGVKKKASTGEKATAVVKRVVPRRKSS
jgi:hypothetical protein